MPKNETLMAELRKRYGDKKAEDVYWGMVGEGKGPFGPKGKYRAEHEAVAGVAGGRPTKGKKKPPAKRRGAKKATRRRR